MKELAVHLLSVHLDCRKYPTRRCYPFNLPVFQHDLTLDLGAPVTFLVGENGCGKSTLLEGVAHLCGIYIWRGADRPRPTHNPYEETFSDYLSIEWAREKVPGFFFGASIFRHFAQVLDEWAATDPGQLDYYGGRSLTTLSHGQSLMAFFRSRCRSKGLFLLDEPETALSPRSQLELLQILGQAGASSPAQFIVATHSPLLLACPGAVVYNFGENSVARCAYEETEHYRIYKAFMSDPAHYLRQVAG
jgi:predicted ATPase